MKNFSSYHAVAKTLSFLILATVGLDISMNVHAGPIGHAPWVGETLKGAPCRGGSENFGPFDYLQRHSLPNELGIVEKYHFGPQVEQLISGMRTGPMGVPDELDYTLRAWPNHHRALNSAIQYQMLKLNKNKNARYPPAECYLERAIKFSPEDGITRMLYGNLLQRARYKTRALQQYEQALELKPENVQIKYNLALLLVDLGKQKRAREYALELYSKGFPLPGLKDKLKKSGHWSKNDDNKKTTESGGVPSVQ
jgi:hypothetical protein